MVLLFIYTVQENFGLKIWFSYAISFAEKIEFPCYLKNDGPVLPTIHIHMCKTAGFWVGWLTSPSFQDPDWQEQYFQSFLFLQ